MSVAVRKLDGVESVTVSLEKASADIRLKPQNTVTLARLRAAIKKNGYATRDAEVEARGKIAARNGATVVDLLNGTTIQVSGGGEAATSGDRVVTIAGVSRVDAKGQERLTISGIR